MCLAIVAFNQSNKYPLILLHNRDEFYDRIAKPAMFWPAHPTIFGGQDLNSQGTWFAVNTLGRFGLITNYRDRKTFRPDAPSRGTIIKDFLLSPVECDSYLNQLSLPRTIETAPNPYNLLFGSMNKLLYYSSKTNQASLLKSGVYGLSNHFLNSPWHKVRRALDLYRQIPISTLSEQSLMSQLHLMLEDDQKASMDDLPETGLPREQEHLISSIFVKTPHYGTMTSSIALFTNNNEIIVSEKSFSPGGACNETCTVISVGNVSGAM